MRTFRALTLIAVIAASGAALPAIAQTASPPQPGYRDATVTLDLKAEGWIETKTALVRAGIEAAFPAGQGGAVRGQALEALQKVAAQGKWFITTFEQVPDPAGLERWRIVAENRLEEKDLVGLRERAQAASRPGMKVVIGDIDFTPTLAEREATLARLRQQIYAEAKAEIARLNALGADRKYEARRIDFQADQVSPPMPRNRALAAAPMAASADAAPPSIDVAQKAIVRAQIVLATRD